MQLDSGNDIESIYDKHQGELVALETQHRDEIDELVAKYESEKAVKEALHDQVKRCCFNQVLSCHICTSSIKLMFFVSARYGEGTWQHYDGHT